MRWSKTLTKQPFGSESSFLLEQFTTLLCGAALCAAALQEQKKYWEKRNLLNKGILSFIARLSHSEH